MYLRLQDRRDSVAITLTALTGVPPIDLLTEEEAKEFENGHICRSDLKKDNLEKKNGCSDGLPKMIRKIGPRS